MQSLEIQGVQSSFDFGNMPTLDFCDFPGMPGFTTDTKEIFSIFLKSIDW